MMEDGNRSRMPVAGCRMPVADVDVTDDGLSPD
jgi:hypothetical protein